MNANQAITSDNWDNHDTLFKPNFSSLLMVRKIALIITNIIGPYPLPCPLPWCGRGVGKYFSVEILKSVAISCVTDCKVLVIENASFSLNPIRYSANDAIHNMIRS